MGEAWNSDGRSFSVPWSGRPPGSRGSRGRPRRVRSGCGPPTRPSSPVRRRPRTATTAPPTPALVTRKRSPAYPGAGWRSRSAAGPSSPSPFPRADRPARFKRAVTFRSQASTLSGALPRMAYPVPSGPPGTPFAGSPCGAWFFQVPIAGSGPAAGVRCGFAAMPAQPSSGSREFRLPPARARGRAVRERGLPQAHDPRSFHPRRWRRPASR